MSYSFSEVLPFMLIMYKNGRDLMFNLDLFKSVLNDENKANELYQSYKDITSEYDDETFVFDIPAFTGTHYKDKVVRSFEAKKFNITLKSFETEMDGYEGKINYHYYADLIDEDSREKMELYYYYDTNMSLREVDIRALKKKKKTKKK